MPSIRQGPRQPVVPRYAVRTARPTYSSAPPGASCPAPPVHTARRRLVRVARTYSTRPRDVRVSIDGNHREVKSVERLGAAARADDAVGDGAAGLVPAQYEANLIEGPTTHVDDFEGDADEGQARARRVGCRHDPHDQEEAELLLEVSLPGRKDCLQ
eukprot:scaffold16484_cov69-Phaeocystis_antarctica.AAC.2